MNIALNTTGKRLLIKGVLHDGGQCNILVENGRFAAFDAPGDTPSERCIEASGMAIMPAFYNTHTHAAMALLRGYADDMPLDEWLRDHIWPVEDTFGPDDIERGSRIAVREMVSSGTVFFNDMYFDIERTLKVASEAGIRCAAGVTFVDLHDEGQLRAKREMIASWTPGRYGFGSLTVAPHAIYTAGRELLVAAARLARDNGLTLHIHLAETKKEVDDCIAAHGLTPVRYLDSIGFLGPDVVAAHCVFVDRQEWDILAARGVTVSHCPCSNMKLSSGIFPYEDAIASGVRLTLGTDGAASNNNLDMLEEMKFAALLAKVSAGPRTLPAAEILRWATRNGAEAFSIDAGVIEKGRLADAVLIDLHDPKMEPCHNIVSNWVYSADSRAIAAVLCNGEVVFAR